MEGNVSADFFKITAVLVKNNPYAVFFDNDRIVRLAEYINYDVTWDMLEVGLANKYELECCCKYLDVGAVLMWVSVTEGTELYR